MTTQTQYYVTKPGGKPTGPYTIDELEKLAAEGKLTEENIYCVEGMSEWLPISRIVDLPQGKDVDVPPVPAEPSLPSVPKVPSVPTGAQTVPSVPQAPTGDKPNTHMTGAFIALVVTFLSFFFSLPLALVALVQACRADSAWTRGDAGECRRLAGSALLWLKMTWGFTILQLLLVIVGAVYVGVYLYPELERELNNRHPLVPYEEVGEF